MAKTVDPAVQANKSFDRKVRLSRFALFFERLWPRFWSLLAVAGFFLLVSLGGLWPALDGLTHQVVLGLFAFCALVAAVYIVRTPWPTRDEAIRRMERRSGVAHRPASSYEDTVSSASSDPASTQLWAAHKERLRKSLETLRPGSPRPRTDHADPIAARAAVIVAIAALLGLAGTTAFERFLDAFRLGGVQAGKQMRIDAWVTPPAYTGIPPVMLVDGGRQDVQQKDVTSKTASQLIEVPEDSILTLRAIDQGSRQVVFEVLSDGAEKPVVVGPESSEKTKDDKTAQQVNMPATHDGPLPVEIRYSLKAPSRIRALAGGDEIANWTFDVTPDAAPKIALLNESFQASPRGSMKLSYKAEDDYGVASAVAKVKRADNKSNILFADRSKLTKLRGPRLPLLRPPVLPLKLSPPGGKSIESSTLMDLGSHPWAGQRVIMWLEATDVSGKTGMSDAIEIILPMRQFRNPLARAVIEQRSKLADDSRNRPEVLVALDALMLEPDGFIENPKIYLGLRTAYYRLQRDTGVRGLQSVIEQLWEVALQIEDGSMADAERALKEAQDKLSKALQEGASDEELQKLMQELKQAFNDYMNELQKNADKQSPQDGDQSQEEIGQQDLQEMMKQLEDMTQNGSREQAEKMLSDLRELMDRLQAQRSPQSQEQQARNREMRKKMDELGDLVGEQKSLMDDTFGEQRNRDKQSDGSGEQNQEGAQGGQPQDSPGSPGNEQAGQGQPGSGQQQLAPGQNRSGERGRGSLSQRQQQLRERLSRLQKELNELGSGSDKFGEAERSMKEAQDQLQQDQLGDAARQQASALDQLRQGAQQMMQQMQNQQGNRRMGENGDSPRDPLGRPQRMQGPDLGTSVKVPDQIDAQRAREILDELRRRSGEALRPRFELDYIERLLRRF